MARKKKTSFSVQLAGLLACALASNAPAQTTWCVNNCGHDAWCDGGSSACWNGNDQPQVCAKKTIKAGMNIPAVANGHTILVAPGTYTDSGADKNNRDLEFPRTGGVAKAITVKCSSCPGSCILDVGGTPNCPSGALSQHRGFWFNNDRATNASVVDGFTIKNGCIRSSALGGAIYIDHSEPTIKNCVLANNRAASGGGAIAMTGQSPEERYEPVIENCTITNNHATSAGQGGGIFANVHVDPKITNCLISGNSASNKGGGLYYNIGSDPRIDNCVIEHNTASQGGGGIYAETVKDESNFRRFITRSRIGPNNRATNSRGGGIWINGTYSLNILTAQFFIENCTIIENHAEAGEGGGIAFFGGDSEAGFELQPTLANTVIAGNTAMSGGGLYIDDYTIMTAANVTMMHNKALGPYGGSAIFFEGFRPSTMSNAVLWYDTNPPEQDEPQVRLGSSSAYWDKLTVQRSDVQDTLPAHVLFNNNVDPPQDPLFADRDGYDNNAATIIDNDYHLASGSVCNDRGSVLLLPLDDLDLDGNGDTTQRIPFDRESRDRFEDDPLAPNNLGVDEPPNYDVDIGAFEYGGCPTGTITAAIPADGTRDARQPHPLDDNSLGARQGIGSPNTYTCGPEPIDITLHNAGLPLRGAGILDCWDLCETGIEPVEGIPPLNPNRIISVSELPEDVYGTLGVYRIFLDRPTSAQHWTTIEYLGDGSYVSYASLPGDVTRNGATTPSDISYLNAVLNGGCDPQYYTVYQWDMNHNGICEAGSSGDTDLVRISDMFNGVQTFIPWVAKFLSANTCAGGEEALAWNDEETLVDGFVEFFTTYVPSETETDGEVDAFLDWVADLAIMHLSQEEISELVERLSDYADGFASKDVEDLMPKVISGLTE